MILNIDEKHHLRRSKRRIIAFNPLGDFVTISSVLWRHYLVEFPRSSFSCRSYLSPCCVKHLSPHLLHTSKTDYLELWICSLGSSRSRLWSPNQMEIVKNSLVLNRTENVLLTSTGTFWEFPALDTSSSRKCLAKLSFDLCIIFQV